MTKKPSITNNHASLLCARNSELFLYLFLAWSLAVSQPLMALFGRQPVFLIAHDVSGWLLIVETLLLNFVPPLLLFAIIQAIGAASINLKEWVTRLIITLLLTLFIMPLCKDAPSFYPIIISFLAAILLVFALIRVNILKTFALWFAPASLIFIIIFFFYSPAKQLLPSFTNLTQSKKLTQASNDTPVFFIIFDEFPLLSLLQQGGDIDESRFPNFAKLTQQATWYPNAIAISNATEIVIPSILSGIKPNLSSLRLGTVEQYPENLFTLFGGTHRINAIENTTRMCPQFLCQPMIENPMTLLLEDSFVSYLHHIFPTAWIDKLPAINNRWVGFLREQKTESHKTYDYSARLDKVLNFIDSFQDFPTNTFHFLHVLMPHAPWRLLPDLRVYSFYEGKGIVGELRGGDKTAQYVHQWTQDEWATQLSWRRHLLQVGAVDTLVGQTLDKIKSLGLYDKATILIVADHGAAFRPGLSRRFAHFDNIPDIASIPLFIKYPNQNEGRIDTRHASNLDIFPTLLNLYSKKTKKYKPDGIDLLSQNKRVDAAKLYQDSPRIITSLPKDYQELFNQHLERKSKLFNKKGWKGIYHTQKSDAFYAKDISTLTINETIPHAINLMNANLFSNIKSESQYIPAYYRLKYIKDKMDFKEILVAFNGKLVSHCFMFTKENKDCAGLIDPELYLKSGNKKPSLRFFSVLNKEEDRYNVNELLLNNSRKARLESDNNQDRIIFDDGTIKKIQTNSAPYGKVVTRLTNNGTTYNIDGWAGNTLTGKPAQEIYIFIDGELISITSPNFPDKSLELKYGFNSLDSAGFKVTIPVEQFPKLAEHKIRVFAIDLKGHIGELNYLINSDHLEYLSAYNINNNRVIHFNKNAIYNLKNNQFTKRRPLPEPLPILQMTFNFSKLEFENFNKFYYEDLKSGTLEFQANWFGIVNMKFLSSPKVTPIGNFYYKVDITGVGTTPYSNEVTAKITMCEERKCIIDMLEKVFK